MNLYNKNTMSLLSEMVFDDMTAKLNKTDNGPTNRVIILVDMDCFYCQVEEKLQPHLAGKPLAVVQYNAWKGGGIIAVNYPARAKGVTRHMRGDEAKKKCPEIELVKVPCVRGKADLTKYREAGKEVAEVLKTFTPLLERASVDEAYLDVTEAVEKRIFHLTKPIARESLENTFVVGCSIDDFLHNLYEDEDLNIADLKLAVGAVIAEMLRAEVYKKTGYRCSAGVAHNKILAKQACGINKPNKQTILPHGAVETYYETLPVHKITGLGGKFGTQLAEKLGVQFMGELISFSEKELQQKFDEKTANWLYNIARGIDSEPVTTRLVSKSIGCCKKFPGKSALLVEEDVTHWLFELAQEISERLEQDQAENSRKARQVVVSFSQQVDRKDVSSSRSAPLNSYEPKKIFDEAFDVIKRFCLKADGGFHLKFLGLSAGHFEDMKNVREITSFFKVGESKSSTEKQDLGKIDKDKNLDRFFSSMEKAEPQSFLGDESELEEKRLLSIEDEAGPSTSRRTDDDADSISSELVAVDETPHTETIKDTTSFFINYLSSVKREDDSPTARNFNTSKILEEQEEEVVQSDSSGEKCLNFEQQSVAVGLRNGELDENGRVTCEECGKLISALEITSHMDYHYALKIVRSEADLYKEKPTEPKAISIGAKSSSTRKRKQSEPEKTGSLIKYLQKQGEQSEAEMCSECNKRIRLEEVESHRDYHVAKKLHMEMNTPKPSPVAESNAKGSTGKVKNSGAKAKSKRGAKPKGKVKSVASFFKPL